MNEINPTKEYVQRIELFIQDMVKSNQLRGINE